MAPGLEGGTVGRRLLPPSRVLDRWLGVFLLRRSGRRRSRDGEDYVTVLTRKQSLDSENSPPLPGEHFAPLGSGSVEADPTARTRQDRRLHRDRRSQYPVAGSRRVSVRLAGRTLRTGRARLLRDDDARRVCLVTLPRAAAH